MLLLETARPLAALLRTGTNAHIAGCTGRSTAKADVLDALVLGQLEAIVFVGAVVFEVEVLAAVLGGFTGLVLLAAAPDDPARGGGEEEEEAVVGKMGLVEVNEVLGCSGCWSGDTLCRWRRAKGRGRGLKGERDVHKANDDGHHRLLEVADGQLGFALDWLVLVILGALYERRTGTADCILESLLRGRESLRSGVM